ncbi:hypothetical protein [Anabaena catenula]|uniref:Uncharacterized protein n=1 Tax=Anabaena catenula FACHB-362 TaxID=2692877 RepID=A0ABR8J1C0_9NOST|nr:hypothetical protein [Anabaena catenula]MBD2692117.1 hypothetical protein [Anabaena catenula FACHB-362]
MPSNAYGVSFRGIKLRVASVYDTLRERREESGAIALTLPIRELPL